MNSNPCSLISAHTMCVQFYLLLKSQARTYIANRGLFHPISESSVILTYFQTKNTLIRGDIIPTYNSVSCQHGGPDSIFLQSILVVRWTKWQWGKFSPLDTWVSPCRYHFTRAPQSSIFVTDATLTQQLTPSLNNTLKNIQPVFEISLF